MLVTTRQVTWTQLQIIWKISWPNQYRVARFAESFCAYLQIILVELADLELTIFPGTATVQIQVSTEDKFQFKERRGQPQRQSHPEDSSFWSRP